MNIKTISDGEKVLCWHCSKETKKYTIITCGIGGSLVAFLCPECLTEAYTSFVEFWTEEVQQACILAEEHLKQYHKMVNTFEAWKNENSIHSDREQ